MYSRYEYYCLLGYQIAHGVTYQNTITSSPYPQNILHILGFIYVQVPQALGSFHNCNYESYVCVLW